MKTDLKAKYSNVLLGMRVTEKAGNLSAQNIYTFEINNKSNKKDVISAIKAFYDVNPLKVNVVRNKGKKVLIRGKFGFKSGLKKAYVYLKKGDKLE